MQPEIKLVSQLSKAKAIVYIIHTDDKTSKTNFPEYATFVASFAKEEKEIDFIKKEDGSWMFFVKANKDAEKNRMTGHSIRKQLPKEISSVCISDDSNAGLQIAEGLALSNYQFLVHLTGKNRKEYALASIELVGKTEKETIQQLNNIIKTVYWARELVNEPHSHLTATQLAQAIDTTCSPAGINVTILEKKQIEALKMGGLIAVNLGSEEPPTFTIMEYKPKNPKNKKPIVLVGKGVVYDTGGLSLKPTAHSMDLMKSDMGGAACMAGTIYGLALNKAQVHVIGLIPSTDNRPGKNAYAPGDIINMYNGLTVEVLNTDAEGRMILADALSYGDKYSPELVIDAATLTGAAVRAIGTKASIVMGNADEKLINRLMKSGTEVHERLVHLPFWDEYGEEMKSDIADLKNIGGPYAGMISAGKFLENFTKSPYIHLDIAGPAFLESEDGYRGKGGTGTGIRALINFLSNY